MSWGSNAIKTTTSESNIKVIITRTITPKIASDCQTQFDLLLWELNNEIVAVLPKRAAR